MQYLFVLGASDPEMQYIERLALTHGHQVVHAFSRGRRVHAGNAYDADFIPVSTEDYPGQVVWVECAMQNQSGTREVVVDHHQPGDPGYDLPPASYWKGSSLGQVCELIGVRPSRELRMAAAADHCLSAAYQGLCPGVDRLEFRRWRLKMKARWKRVDVQALADRVSEAVDLLASMKKVRVGEYEFVDALDHRAHEIAEASAILGYPVMYAIEDQRTGLIKVGALNGSAEMMRAWMDYAHQVMKLKDVYGSPVRGYAGGYFDLKRS